MVSCRAMNSAGGPESKAYSTRLHSALSPLQLSHGPALRFFKGSFTSGHTQAPKPEYHLPGGVWPVRCTATSSCPTPHFALDPVPPLLQPGIKCLSW